MTGQANPAVKTALWGVVLMLAGSWFWHSLVGNPLDDLALIRRGEVASALIVDTSEDAQSGDEGGTYWFHDATYSFSLPDGRKLTHRTSGSGRLRAEFRDIVRPVPIEIEYLPDDPSVSRIKGSGTQTVLDWMWRDFGIGGLLLALFLAPGLTMLHGALRPGNQHRRAANDPSA